MAISKCISSAVSSIGLTIVLALGPNAPAVADIANSEDHPAVGRYPGAEITWQRIDNFAQYRIPTGPVTGYRHIDTWIDVEGRVTRTFYELTGERTHAEVWANYRDALTDGGFEIIAQGLDPASNAEIGHRQWLSVYYRAVPFNAGGEPVSQLLAGKADQGGSGIVFGRRQRAEDTIYALVSLEQHDADTVAVLVDVVETKEAESGRVVADAEAIGRDIEDLGRVVLEGLYFDHDSDTLTAASAPALVEIARFLENAPDKGFYIVGHTDNVGTFAYNIDLSRRRAESVRSALVADYGIASERLQAHGSGPTSPVRSNSAETGRAANRRVELVER